MEDLHSQEQLVDQYISQDNKESAVKLLFKLIVAYAKGKDFVRAEALKDKLFKVDPMAIKEIIESGEIIEEEKNKSKDKKHMTIWSEMYSKLSEEETNTLYYAMRPGTCDIDKPLFVQGKENTKLYFIRQGQVKLIWDLDGREVLLDTLGPGQILGEDTFFGHTLCTTSAIVISRTEFVTV